MVCLPRVHSDVTAVKLDACTHTRQGMICITPALHAPAGIPPCCQGRTAQTLHTITAAVQESCARADHMHTGTRCAGAFEACSERRARPCQKADLAGQPVRVALGARIKAQLQRVGPVSVAALAVQQHGQPVCLVQQHRVLALSHGLQQQIAHQGPAAMQLSRPCSPLVKRGLAVLQPAQTRYHAMLDGGQAGHLMKGQRRRQRAVKAARVLHIVQEVACLLDLPSQVPAQQLGKCGGGRGRCVTSRRSTGSSFHSLCVLSLVIQLGWGQCSAAVGVQQDGGRGGAIHGYAADAAADLRGEGLKQAP